MTAATGVSPMGDTMTAAASTSTCTACGRCDPTGQWVAPASNGKVLCYGCAVSTFIAVPSTDLDAWQEARPNSTADREASGVSLESLAQALCEAGVRAIYDPELDAVYTECVDGGCGDSDPRGMWVPVTIARRQGRLQTVCAGCGRRGHV